MEFTAADRESTLWKKLTAHYRERLTNLREQNDSTMSDEKRNLLIGRIQEVKTLLAIEKPGVMIPKS